MTTEGFADAQTTESLRGAEGDALYVHLPFCAAKCHYCDFFSVPVDRPTGGAWDVDAMVDAILAEARVRAPRSPRTLFLGGGTPSLLSAAQLARLLDGLHDLTGWRDSVREATAECNPESLDEAKARAFLDLGVPRLSIGFQSLDDRTLQLFGRVHSTAESFAAFEAARAAGVRHLNVDLIYAAPEQTADDWARDLGRVLELGSEHLSAYNLTFEEDTRFKRWLDRGVLQRSAEEVELEMFETTRRMTRGAGLEAYEISNFARPDEACEHNLNYWANGPYVGLGPGAVSRVGAVRAGNPRGIGPYLRQIAATGAALEWTEELGLRARLGETWWLGLRLAHGVDPAEARVAAAHGHPDVELGEHEDPALATAAELSALGLLEEAGGRWRLTERGLPVADAVARRFLDSDAES